MRKAIIAMSAMLCVCAAAFFAPHAQSAGKPKAAVYIVGNPEGRDMLMELVNNFLIKSGRYQMIAVDAIDIIAKEHKRQMGGSVKDADIAKLGQDAGAEYVCVVARLTYDGGTYISTKMVGVQSKIAELSEVTELGKGQKIIDVVQRQINNMLGIGGGGGGQAVPQVVVPPAPVVQTPTTPAPAPSANVSGRDFRDDRVGIDMVFVKGGTFMMGCTAEQGSDCDSDEKPAHSVTVSDFYIGKYPVTQKQWVAVMGSNPSYFKGNDNLPVEQVSWKDVQEFISRLNSMTGRRYRLLTEAEWEFAARGGVSSRGYKYSGSNNIFDVAWHKDNSGGKTRPVGGKAANELGIFDMSGNVWEWVSDLKGSYGSSSQTNPQGPSSRVNIMGIWGDGEVFLRVIRGGSWSYGARRCRVSFRNNVSPDDRSGGIGFRLALSSP